RDLRPQPDGLPADGRARGHRVHSLPRPRDPPRRPRRPPLRRALDRMRELPRRGQHAGAAARPERAPGPVRGPDLRFLPRHAGLHHRRLRSQPDALPARRRPRGRALRRVPPHRVGPRWHDFRALQTARHRLRRLPLGSMRKGEREKGKKGERFVFATTLLALVLLSPAAAAEPPSSSLPLPPSPSPPPSPTLLFRLVGSRPLRPSPFALRPSTNPHG